MYYEIIEEMEKKQSQEIESLGFVITTDSNGVKAKKVIDGSFNGTLAFTAVTIRGLYRKFIDAGLID